MYTRLLRTSRTLDPIFQEKKIVGEGEKDKAKRKEREKKKKKKTKKKKKKKKKGMRELSLREKKRKGDA
jgi:hypothetical protein